MTVDRGANSDDHKPVSRDELDRLINRELSPEERRAFVGRLRHDPDALNEVVEMRRLAGRFREHAQGPDLTDRVLEGVDRRRGFLSSRLRRRVKQGRAMMAAAVLLAMFSLAVAHRMNPDAFRVRDAATPVADLGDAVVRDSIESRRLLADAVRGLEPVGLIDESVGASGSLGLAEFHVPIGSEARIPDEVPVQYLTLTACADAEVLALGGARGMFASIELTSIVDGEGSLADSGIVWSAPGSFTSMAIMSMRLNSAPSSGILFKADRGTGFVVEPGVVPMSLMPSFESAYVGRFDPFDDGSLDNERAKTQPDGR